MNYNYAFVSNPQILFFERRENKIIPQQSLDLLLSNLQLPLPMLKTWIKHPKRRTYFGVTLSRNGNTGQKYNLFSGWAIEPKQHDCSNFLNFIYNVICDQNQKIYEWLLDWLAHMFQFPERKSDSTVAVALRGLKGIGKNFFAEKIIELIGERHSMLIQQEDLLFGRFKEHLLGLVLIVLDEIGWGGNKKQEKELKGMVTGDKLVVEPKGRKPILIDNFARFLFLGNESWMLPASVDERRFLVLDVPDTHRKDYDYFSNLHKHWNQGEKEGFLYYLLNRKISHNLREAIWTEALKDQVLRGLEPHQEWILDALDEGAFVVHDRDGEIAGQANWESATSISISFFYESYLDYISRRQKQKYALSKRALKREIERFLQCEIKSEQNARKTKRVYLLPDPTDLKCSAHLIKFFPDFEAPF
jgi:phage/plasmid-associated DNA primase